MKTLVEDSIKLWYTGKGPQVKTIFNSADRESAKYYDISKLCGREMGIDYEYTEGGQTEQGEINVSIPNGLTESAVKSHIIAAINQSLGN